MYSAIRRLSPRSAAFRFVSAACERDAACAEFSGDLFDAFKLWCSVTETRPMSQTALGRELTKLGFEVRKVGHGNRKARLGLRLKACFTKREKPLALFPKTVPLSRKDGLGI